MKRKISELYVAPENVTVNTSSELSEFRGKDLVLSVFPEQSSSVNVEEPTITWNIYTYGNGIDEAISVIDEIMAKCPESIFKYFNPKTVVFVDKIVYQNKYIRQRQFAGIDTYSTEWITKKIFDYHPSLQKFYEENTWRRVSVEDDSFSIDWGCYEIVRQ